MANEISNSGMVSAGVQIAAALSAAEDSIPALFDRAPIARLARRRPWSAFGSKTMRVTRDAVPAVWAAASSETSGGASNTAYSPGYADYTVAGQTIQYDLTNLGMIAGGPQVNIDKVAGTVFGGAERRLNAMLTALFTSLSAGVGSTGVAADDDLFFAAMYVLNLANNGNGANFIGHAQQINDLIEAFRHVPNLLQPLEDQRALFASTVGYGYKGTLLGVNLIQSDAVPTANANADRLGAMFAADCFGYSIAPPALFQPLLRPDDILLQTEELVILRNPELANGKAYLHGWMYPAFAIDQNAAGVKVLSRNTP